MEEYKNILWLEDADTSEGEVADLEAEMMGVESDSGLCSLFSDFFEESAQVRQVRYFDALKNEIRRLEQYDLIVFDINMNKDSSVTENYSEIMQILKDSGIKIPSAIEQSRKEFIERAGIYLYLYYAINGYPTKRMVILTGNSDSYCKLETIRPVNDILKKDDIQGKYEWINQFYQNKNTYYRIRRLVFQACEYWKTQLHVLKSEQDISFNQLYFQNNPKDMLPVSEFEEMLNRIELMMPVTLPADSERLYYQIMHTVSALHESKAVIGKLDSDYFKGLQKYHSCIRNFRNWSSHNKLTPKKLKFQEFALLFCIALRTYFMGSYEKPYFDDVLYSYEENYSFRNPREPKKNDLQNIVHSLLIDMIKKSNDYSNSLEKMIVKYSETKNVQMEIKYLIFSLWSSKELIQRTDSQPMKAEASGDGTIVDVTVQKSASYRINTAECENLCKKAKENTAESVFMRYCFTWLR